MTKVFEHFKLWFDWFESPNHTLDWAGEPVVDYFRPELWKTIDNRPNSFKDGMRYFKKGFQIEKVWHTDIVRRN